MADSSKEFLIFISFASQERELAVHLQEIIETAFKDIAAQVKVFVSDTTITAGELWENEIKKNIKGTKLVFTLCSPLSVERQWVNFECGASYFSLIKSEGLSESEKSRVVPLCHFGLGGKSLTPFIKWEDPVDAHGQKYLDKIITIIIEALENEFEGFELSEEERSKIENIAKSIQKINKKYSDFVSRNDKKAEKEREKKEPPKFMLASLNYDGNVMKIVIEKDPGTGRCLESQPIDVKKKIERPEYDEILLKITRMNAFLKEEARDSVDNVGIAIGIQNCVYDGEHVYVGVRMKSITDAYASSVVVSKGKFNTGYELLRKAGQEKLLAIDNLQDPFVVMPWHVKHTLQAPGQFSNDSDNDKIYNYIALRIKAVGGRLWPIRFPNGQEGIATIFTNNSKYFPRFEIGVWKYINISDLKIRNTLKQKGVIAGFGEDIFLDYRGREHEEDTPVNYWIWVRGNEIFYWSYPEERLIPRYKPARHYQKPMHAVLVTRDHMIRNYGNPVKHTPFTSYENLRNYPDEILSEQFSFPARALLSCF